MTDQATPAKVRLTDGLGPLVDSEEDPARLWAEIHKLVLTAVHHAVEACASATGQHRVIAHFVNKTHLANEVMEAVSSVAAEVRA